MIKYRVILSKKNAITIFIRYFENDTILGITIYHQTICSSLTERKRSWERQAKQHHKGLGDWLWNGWVQGSSTAQHSEHSDCYAGKLLNLQNMNIYKSLGHNFTISKFGLLLTDSFHRGKHWLQTHLVATGMSIVFSQQFWSRFFDLIGVKKIVV